MDTAASGHDAPNQQGPVHVIAAGHQQGVADAGTAQVVHQGGEVGESVAGAVIELNLMGGQPFPLLEDPVGVLGIAAAAHHHRQAIAAGQISRDQLPVLVATEHQDHLGRRRLGPPPAARQPEQPTSSQGRQPQTTATGSLPPPRHDPSRSTGLVG